MRKGIFIDYKNKEQVKWWNERASKMVKVVRYDNIVETATEKPVGVIFGIKGIFANKIAKENAKFIKNATKVIYKNGEIEKL